MRRQVFVLLIALALGCTSATPAAPTATPAPPPPTATPAPTSTPAPTATAAPVPGRDYKAIRQPLLIPLGALIVARRAGQPTAAAWLTEFNKAADQVLPAIEGDTSVDATRLRTAITDIRAMPTDLQVLERSRS